MKIALLLISFISVVSAESYDAVLEPKTRKLLSVQMDGILLKSPVIGTRFKHGELLIQQPVDLIETSIEQIKADIKSLQSEYDYYDKLVKKKKDQLKDGIIRREEFDAVSHELSKVANKITSYKIELKKENIKISLSKSFADLNGIVTKEFKHKGEFARIGDACIEVIDDSILYAIFPYDATKADLLKLKEISVSIAGSSYPGRIALISPEVDSASGYVQVKVAVNNTDLKIRTGLKCKVLVADK